MKNISKILTSRIEQILKSNHVFAGQSDVTVSSRVKVSWVQKIKMLCVDMVLVFLQQPTF